jgi:hypothetical protein
MTNPICDTLRLLEAESLILAAIVDVDWENLPENTPVYADDSLRDMLCLKRSELCYVKMHSEPITDAQYSFRTRYDQKTSAWSSYVYCIPISVFNTLHLDEYIAIAKQYCKH